MSNDLLRKSSVVTSQLRNDIPEFKVGTQVQVHYKIKEGEKERVQLFEGIVIAINNKTDINTSFTVLKNATGAIKVERVFPLHSPMIEKLVVVGGIKRTKRAKQYSLRGVKEPNKSVRSKVVKAK